MDEFTCTVFICYAYRVEGIICDSTEAAVTAESTVEEGPCGQKQPRTGREREIYGQELLLSYSLNATRKVMSYLS